MDPTVAFTDIAAAAIVTEDMYQHRNPRPSDGLAVEFSEEDRDDAARLLALITGKRRAQHIACGHDPTKIARAILEDRKVRASLFNPGMFGEPAWEILLTLFIVDEDGPRLTIGRLIQLAGSPQTTSLRWLDYLEDQELIAREEHPRDARTAFVQLTDKARQALTKYLSSTITPHL
jgi:DNA-binding MarR family transcriptional regulator